MAKQRQQLAIDEVLEIITEMREELVAVQRSLERLKAEPFATQGGMAAGIVLNHYPTDSTKAASVITRKYQFWSQGSYLIPMTMESGPTKCSTRVSRNPASFIHAEQSAPV